jgi:hypothetical protein
MAISKDIPHFVIVNNPQKGGYKYVDILTDTVLQDVCRLTTGCNEYTVEFIDTGYNKGRLAALYFQDETIYISFSETGTITARNSFFQSLTTAFRIYSGSISKARICFYFLPFEGNVETNYFMYMYRLMATVGVEFLNAPSLLSLNIKPFTTVDDIIAIREMNTRKNRGNNSTYITRGMNGIVQIYGKTYGASKKETALMCIAVSKLAQQVELYEICEQNLSALPETDLAVIKNIGNVQIIQTDYTMERKEFEENNSLRSPLFKYNLLEKLGPKRCALCDCKIPELIEGAHIWPVHDIKKAFGISLDKKIEYATDGDNGIWLCENHHKLFDEGFIIINSEGIVQYDGTMKDEYLKFIVWATTITAIKREILTEKFGEFLTRRYEEAA